MSSVIRERILVVEDDDSLRDVLSSVLEHEGYVVTSVHSAEKALQQLQMQGVDCVISDYKLPRKTGLQLLEEFRASDLSTPFIIMTAYGTIDIAIEAMKAGANDFITKPFETDELKRVLREVLDHRQVVFRSSPTNVTSSRIFVTHDEKTESVLQYAKRVAKFDTTVLILGESGTGKELMARYIHQHSSRSGAPFVAVNCAALPPELLESEFFGHEAGAFTGATQQRIGLLEFASGGTIFLDEVGDMPPALQVKLLRALQEKEIKRVGGKRSIPIEPRVVAATNVDLETAISEGKIREDFYYRLAVFTLEIPPLRERPKDTEALTSFFLATISHKLGRKDIKISREAFEFIQKYPWPGNARQLENALERAVVLAKEEIQIQHLGVSLNLDIGLIEESKLTLPEIVEQATRKAETELIRNTLRRTEWNRTEAARVLGVSYKTLLNKMKEYDIRERSSSAAYAQPR